MEVVISARADGLIVDLRCDGAPLMPREIGVITESIALDGGTNVGLLSRLSANPYQFRLIGGTLSEEGVPVTINPDGEGESVRKTLSNRIQAARNYINNDTPTNAQTVAAVKGILELLIWLIIHKGFSKLN